MKKSLSTLLVFLILMIQSCSPIPDKNTLSSNETISSAMAELQEAQTEVEQLKQRNALLRKELSDIRGKINLIEYDLQNQRKVSEAYKRKNQNLNSQLSVKKEKLGKVKGLKNQYNAKRKELDKLKNLLALSTEREKISQEKLTNTLAELDAASSSLAEKEKEYADLFDSIKIAGEVQKNVAQNEGEKLLNASVVFNTPKSLFVGESSEVSLKIFVEKAIDDAVQEFTDSSDVVNLQDNTIHSKETKLGKVVVASLRASSGISVQSLSGAGDDSDGRVLDTTNPDNNQWNWEISAKNEGDQWIRVSLYYEKKNQDGFNESISFGTWRSETIQVSVKPMDSISAFFDKYIMPNIEFLWGALLLPLGAFIGARWKKRKE